MYILRREKTDIICGYHVITWHNESFYESKERAEFKLGNMLEQYKLGYWEVESQSTWHVVLHDKRERNKKLTLDIEVLIVE